MSIKASEVSDVLKIDSRVKFEEVGKVLQVSDGVVRIYGLQNAEDDYLGHLIFASTAQWSCETMLGRPWNE